MLPLHDRLLPRRGGEFGPPQRCVVTPWSASLVLGMRPGVSGRLWLSLGGQAGGILYPAYRLLGRTERVTVMLQNLTLAQTRLAVDGFWSEGLDVMPESRKSILERLRRKVAAGWPIVGGGAGTGISAKCEEAGEIDLIVIYNSGRFRMAGRGSMAGLMPYGNANAIVKEMAYEVLTAVSHTPVLAGVCATDPFMIRDLFLRELKEMGFAGIQNFPTVGLIDGVFRINLEETGMGFGAEIDCIAAAHELDLLTTPYAFDPEQSKLLAQAGADIVVAHMGLTTKGSIGARTAKTLDDCVRDVTAIALAGKGARGDLLVLCHGGPIASPDDAQYILERASGIDGFYGASSMERLPTELAISKQVRDFVGLKLSQRETMV